MPRSIPNVEEDLSTTVEMTVDKRQPFPSPDRYFLLCTCHFDRSKVEWRNLLRRLFGFFDEEEGGGAEVRFGERFLHNAF